MNAGGPPASASRPQLSQWKSGIDLSLLSTILLCRAVVPSMKQRRSRRIAVTSITVKQPVDGSSEHRPR
jgi:NAD(P)-dependent dehydrogenase (short-subunit alcohol dehydrogenase family)